MDYEYRFLIYGADIVKFAERSKPAKGTEVGNDKSELTELKARDAFCLNGKKMDERKEQQKYKVMVKMIELRQEMPCDHRDTENVIREAFWNHYTPACNDHYLIHIMRDCPAFVPELDIVAVEDGRIIGNSMCLKSYIVGDDGKSYEVLSLGPIGVLPEYQHQGIGGRLIARTKEIAKGLGFRGILLCGDPDYYTRQGFVSAEKYEIRNAENMYADALLACELYQGAFSEISGCYYEDEIYNVDENCVKEFDKQFPVKEIVYGTPMQKKFEMMIERVKPCQR